MAGQANQWYIDNIDEIKEMFTEFKLNKQLRSSNKMILNPSLRETRTSYAGFLEREKEKKVSQNDVNNNFIRWVISITASDAQAEAQRLHEIRSRLIKEYSSVALADAVICERSLAFPEDSITTTAILEWIQKYKKVHAPKNVPQGPPTTKPRRPRGDPRGGPKNPKVPGQPKDKASGPVKP